MKSAMPFNMARLAALLILREVMHHLNVESLEVKT
jgi:hypothetical protein